MFCFVASIIIPIYSKKYLNSQQQNILGWILGTLIASNYIVWVILEIIAGTFDIKIHLPFHLCRVANMMILLVMIYKNNLLFQIVYYWGMSGVFQGIVTPDIVNDFPHFHFIRFWLGHNGMVICLVYAIVVHKMRPSILGLKYAFISINIFLMISIIANLILDANYFWICGKPPVKSLLDYLGPWPWYILSAQFIALLNFVLAYLPFYMLKKSLR